MTKVLGWREWVSLPDLGIGQIKAKVDTGARTSALHAFDVQVVEDGGQKSVKFSIHPKQKDLNAVIKCQAPLLDERAEVTLTNRDSMGFRMLIGRTTMKGHYLVDPGKSYQVGKRKKPKS